MALFLLLDENISPVVAEQVRAKRPDIGIESIYAWRGGAYLSVPDLDVLLAAQEDRCTLVTYDTQILSELAFLFEENVPLAGLVFVDEKTIASSDFGGLVRALVALWDAQGQEDWTGKLVFLQAS